MLDRKSGDGTLQIGPLYLERVSHTPCPVKRMIRRSFSMLPTGILCVSIPAKHVFCSDSLCSPLSVIKTQPWSGLGVKAAENAAKQNRLELQPGLQKCTPASVLAVCYVRTGYQSMPRIAAVTNHSDWNMQANSTLRGAPGSVYVEH